MIQTRSCGRRHWSGVQPICRKTKRGTLQEGHFLHLWPGPDVFSLLLSQLNIYPHQVVLAQSRAAKEVNIHVMVNLRVKIVHHILVTAFITPFVGLVTACWS